MATRKQFLTLARFMSITTSGNLSGITEKAYTSIIDSYRHDDRFPPYDPSYLSAYQKEVRNHVDGLFRDPVFAGQVIQSIFMAEVPDSIADDIRKESYEKEYSIMSTSGYDPGLDFSCFFGEYTRPLHCTMLPNPRMARHIHRIIDEWITQVTSVDFYVPTISSKLLPEHTRRDLVHFADKMTESPEVATYGSLERLEEKFGIQIQGDSEMKQRWYTNGLAPRSYFVAGADAYRYSKFTQKMWNALVDNLEVTNRFNRVNPRRIHIDAAKTTIFSSIQSSPSEDPHGSCENGCCREAQEDS